MFSGGTEREHSPEIAEALSIKTHKYLCCKHENIVLNSGVLKKKINLTICSVVNMAKN